MLLKIYLKLTTVIIRVSFHKNQGTLNNPSKTCRQLTSSKVLRRKKTQKRTGTKTDRTHTKNLWSVAAQTRIHQTAIRPLTKIRKVFRNKRLMKRMRLMNKLRLRRKKRQRWSQNGRWKMIWMRWKERWGMRKTSNFLHFRRKWAIFWSSNKKCLQLTWQQLRRMQSCWLNRVSWYQRFKG